LPPAHLPLDAGDARRDQPRAQDHRRRDAPHGDATAEAASPRCCGRCAVSAPGRSAGRRGGDRRRRGVMANINRVILVGNLTRARDLRHTPSGTPVCKLRVAVNTRQKDSSGQWVDKPNYFDVTVWGNQGESCAQYLAKGRPIGVDGRLDWREWEAQDGTKRQAVEIIAENVQFLGGRGDGEGRSQFVPEGAGAVASSDADFASSAADDDIPF